MTSDAASVVRVTKRLTASPERVFDAWLDPRTAGQFLFATPTGKMILVEIDARVGGRFTVVEHRPAGDAEHFGEYLEIDRPRRLAFSFWVETEDPKPTIVMIDITPAGGGCDLALAHEGVLPDYAERTAQGWTMILDGLEKAVGQTTNS
jgi:uncharacterized protein YndB with AHSA1/START domain